MPLLPRKLLQLLWLFDYRLHGVFNSGMDKMEDKSYWPANKFRSRWIHLSRSLSEYFDWHLWLPADVADGRPALVPKRSHMAVNNALTVTGVWSGVLKSKAMLMCACELVNRKSQSLLCRYKPTIKDITESCTWFNALYWSMWEKHQCNGN
jgi:hypothetical protein